MKRICSGICFIITCLLLQAWNKTDTYGQQVRTLDSLSGAVNATVKELEKTDTLILQKAITRFTHYRQFIQQNINDTIAKSEADNLQQFYASGKNLGIFQTNRTSLLARARLINSQLLKLTADIKNNALSTEQATQFILQEKNEAARLTDLGSSQKQVFYSGLEEFKNALRGVEQLIRSHNNGELPTIVKDTLTL
jgi:hypothetical protein